MRVFFFFVFPFSLSFNRCSLYRTLYEKRPQGSYLFAYRKQIKLTTCAPRGTLFFFFFFDPQCVRARIMLFYMIYPRRGHRYSFFTRHTQQAVRRNAVIRICDVRVHSRTSIISTNWDRILFGDIKQKNK